MQSNYDQVTTATAKTRMVCCALQQPEQTINRTHAIYATYSHTERNKSSQQMPDVHLPSREPQRSLKLALGCNMNVTTPHHTRFPSIVKICVVLVTPDAVLVTVAAAD